LLGILLLLLGDASLLLDASLLWNASLLLDDTAVLLSGAAADAVLAEATVGAGEAVATVEAGDPDVCTWVEEACRAAVGAAGVVWEWAAVVGDVMLLFAAEWFGASSFFGIVAANVAADSVGAAASAGLELAVGDGF
jgi:hypothetical protein